MIGQPLNSSSPIQNPLFHSSTKVNTGMGDSDISVEKATIRVTIDLVRAARRHLTFLREVAESHWLYSDSSLLQSIRRYDELWMPMASDLTVGTTRAILLPPLDVQWVWHCHTLNPGSYKRYCESKFSKIIEKPLIYDDGIEEYALNRCGEIWNERYPSEEFELESTSDEETSRKEDLFTEVSKHRRLYLKFCDPYMLEIVYLIAAKQRYKRFMYLLKRFGDGHSRLVPTLDIQLMWLTHQSYPMIYEEDGKGVEGVLNKVVGIWDELKDGEVEGSRKIWEEAFNEPYEKAGGRVARILKPPPVYWAVSDGDVNTYYKSMAPRFLLEVCVFLTGRTETKSVKGNADDLLRLGSIRCHKELKLDQTLTSIPTDQWRKTWHLYSEFSTRGLILELRQIGGRTSCFKKKLRSTTLVFLWNDLLRAPCLTGQKELGKEVRAVASITPPVQAPYLLKCVPDRVTDDSGAMISDEVLKLNRYRPQEGRWLSRTVLDHIGKECFVVRMRVGGGIWRRGGDNLVAVKWEDRIIEVREGSWNYVAGSIGTAPEKVAGTATPHEQSAEKASWSLSTGEELSLHRSSSGFIFNLQNQKSTDSVRLLQGRKMQYQVTNEVHRQDGDKEQQDDDAAFVTLVRYTPGNPNGRATALMNWRLVAVELLPEEDAVMVMLICIAILRSVSEMTGEDMGNLLVRRRLKEYKTGMRDWGSIVVHPSCSSSANSSPSPFLQPWYWNASTVIAPVEADHITRQATPKYSPAEGGDNLYKHAILPKSK